MTAGVFVGCQYVNTQGQTVQAQYYPGNAAASSAIAYVVVDANAAFKVAVTNGSGAVSSTTVKAIGVNLAVDQTNTGSTTTGDSYAGVAVSASATTSTPITTSAAFRIVGVVPESAVTVTANATSSSTTITLSAANSAITPGMAVSGPGITAGSNTYVTAVSSTTVTINTAVASAQATAAQFSFTGYPEVLVAWNAGYHGYNNATGV